MISEPLQRESVSERRLRQYEGVFELTTQMLATPNVEERLLLSLEAVTTGLGFQQAAIALIDERASTLRIRAAVGFNDDEAVERVVLPLDSGAPQVAIVYEGKPVWLSRGDDHAAEAFLTELGAPQAILALPLFGGQRLSKNLNRNLARSPRMADKHWGPEPVTCLGVLYLGAARETVDDEDIEFLLRFADRVGQTVSSALHYDRLTELISKLQRERQWVESIMKSVADPIVLTNLDNEILLQNRRAEELFSGSKNASEGKRRALEMNDLLFSAYLSSAAFSST
ncbi:MAG: GAF domain-containing protein, partial [Acidobacteria bacterium]|nr:GAF domain-containing protein [Acidobacteriota bacterium]